jgi:hypothetical protein
MRPVLFALLCLSTGCYSYTNVETAAPTAPAVVRVELTDEGTVAMTPALGASITTVEGPVLQNSTGVLQLDVRLLRRRGESLMKEWPSDPISIPSKNIRNISVRALDRRKTTIAVVGGTTATALAFILLAKTTSLFTGDDGKVIIGNVR